MRRIALFSAGLLLWAAGAVAEDWSGNMAIEERAFPREASFPDQEGNDLSLAVQPEYYHEWNGGNRSFTFVPFGRLDQADPERTHFDIRELTYLDVGDGVEWRVGIRKLFWGVIESVHLVDIINQTDLVENPDGEDKLGQPMINLAVIRDWGTLDLFLLTGFRERTFPGPEGRLRTPLPVDTDRPVYESDQERGHLDLAARWSRTIGEWDIGLSHFYGTGREPQLIPGMDENGAPVLIPRYEIIQQTGLDLQATIENWLLKLEAIHRTGQDPNFTALAVGFEYTLATIFDTRLDVGLLMEYLHDDRGEEAATPFEDDVFVGCRLAFNDPQTTEALLGAIVDRESQARLISLEAARRFWENWKLGLEARAFIAILETDPLFGYASDDYIQLELTRYF
jgi:hypothetical protein